MGGGAAMRAGAKVAGTGVINHGLRGFSAVPTAEHPFTSTARKATRPVASICSSSDTRIDASAPVQKSCWEIDDWEFAGGEDGVISDFGEPMPRLVFGGAPTLQEAKEATSELKAALDVFEFRLRVSLALDGNLNMISRIRNIDSKPFSFSFAYLTYLLVSDISEVRIEGLETLDYIDNLSERKRFTEQGDAITFESEVDRAYLRSPNCIAVLDHEKKLTFIIRKEGLPDAVVWNPWEKKSKSMADFGDVEYKKMVCVDGAAIERPITLKSREEWTGRLELAVVPSSFCSENFGSSSRHF